MTVRLLLLLHDVLAAAESFLPLPLCRVVRLPDALLLPETARVRLRVGGAARFGRMLKRKKTNVLEFTFFLLRKALLKHSFLFAMPELDHGNRYTQGQ